MSVFVFWARPFKKRVAQKTRFSFIKMMVKPLGTEVPCFWERAISFLRAIILKHVLFKNDWMCTNKSFLWSEIQGVPQLTLKKMRFLTGFCRFAENFYRTENFSLHIVCSPGAHLSIDTKIIAIGALRMKWWLQEKRVRYKIFLIIITSPHTVILPCALLHYLLEQLLCGK